MDFDNSLDDALKAPVWDDLNPTPQQQHDKEEEQTPLVGDVPKELSDTFADLSVSNNNYLNPMIDTITSEEQHGIEPQNLSSTWEGHKQNTVAPEEKHKADLINSLAPEEDPFDDLNHRYDPPILSKNHDASTILTADGSLFTKNELNGPFSSISDDGLFSGVPKGVDIKFQPVRKIAKPHILFDSTTILQHAKRVGEITTQRKSQDNQDNNEEMEEDIDPLGENAMDDEFVDEPLEEKKLSDNPNGQSEQEHNILHKVNEPLYVLSPKKGSTVNESEKNALETNTTMEKTHEQVPDQKSKPQIEKEKETEEKEIPLVDFKIEVKDPIKVGELTSMHVEYTIIAESTLIESSYAQVTRRYRDFRWLYRQLQNNHLGKVIPPPPEKQAIRRFSGDFIENRRIQMENMLICIATDTILQNDPDFLLFLTSTNFPYDCKNRENLTGSNASNDSNDLSEIYISPIQLFGSEDGIRIIRNGGIDAEVNKGFMGMSFSSAPKYTEIDTFFIEQGKSIDDLEEQLKHIYTHLDLLETQRNELAIAMDDFVSLMHSLADLNVTEKSSDVLINFEEIQKEIKVSLERNSLQESIIMGASIDNYMRALASVKAIFNQRAKLGYFSLVVEEERNKKRIQGEKLQKTINPQGDNKKLELIKFEYRLLNTRLRIIRNKWNEVGEKIKLEVKKFDKEKINEFRNSIEISLESSIEAQKECIELWETFYKNNL
ncbi:sorting nexin 1 NDAI_0F00500 [Naumovozyma dairenensis CBS 421]|uniref:PX domain-containing protein n=1 Tax=Naumovozyma dairenensis (strain ATCC 10597 / BCRC 20456 / CBS 421 / NBRC 0211 / NRRL Y-12639) TaxID=1071378 RepID=G0WC58_NAUDC|nr:hypothetical protein NDAI_0F00500 [Naumovozyma dairenensis CBS 421]CCD25369.1 hypothetical protein NDAI_0F00500 [Naumovozyma dairenensis CBS 421]